MNLIDPFQFRDMLRPAHSIAIVGNAPCILDWKNGAVIDSHELVVRFNRARTDGLEEMIGSRTDVLFVNAANTLAKSPPPGEISRPRCVVCFVSPRGCRDCDIAPFREWVGDCPVLLSFGPDLVELPAVPRSKPLTSGTYALFSLLRMFEVRKLFVTGFTMFGAVQGGAGKYWNEAMPAAATVHDLDQEARLFTAILRDFEGETDVTEEVRALARQVGVRIDCDSTLRCWFADSSRSLSKRTAEGLAWRLQKAGMVLRRFAER